MTEPTQGDVVWLTQAKYEELQAELAQLRGPGRADVVKQVSDARDEGDLKENGGYHAAKDEQGKVEARIRQLEDMLRRAEVGETPKDDGIVEPGMVVTVEMFGDKLTFLLGSREIADGDSDLEVYSEKSPMGAAILGHKAGHTASYKAPNGNQVSVEIIDIEPFNGG